MNGQILSYFEHHLKRWLDVDDTALPDNDLLVVRDIGLQYIPRRVICVQKYWRALFMGPFTDVQQFVEMSNDLNCYLLFL
jgi:hypothetical protein